MPGKIADQLPLENVSNPPGWINPHCRYTDMDGQRFIQIDGVVCYIYKLNDPVSESMIWITLHLAGHASLNEIATGTNLARRSMQRWKAAVKIDGLEALLHKPKPGRSRTIPNAKRQEALRLIAEGTPRDWIVYQLDISISSLERIIAADRAKNEDIPEAPLLDFGDDDTDWAAADRADHIPPVNQTIASISINQSPAPAADFDPRNRSADRALARLGLIKDATPQFAPDDRIEGLGFMLAVVLLTQTRVLEIFEHIYGKSLGPAFFGLRTVVMTLLMMALLRIKRPEQLRQFNPYNLGAVLGLDRVMEVKTLRRKLHSLAKFGRGVILMNQLGEDRLQRRDLPGRDGEPRILYLDGHVRCYRGKFKIGKTWSAVKNRVVKGRGDTWLNLPDQTPVYYLESSFNEGLVSVIEGHLDKIEQSFGYKPVLVFDREGWDVDFLYKLTQAGWKFITYRKGNYSDIPIETFKSTPTEVGDRNYAHAPHEIEKQSYNRYETTTDKDGNKTRALIGQVEFREVRILSDDKKHQTAIVTNTTKEEIDTLVVGSSMFKRWGNQENVFKYMIAEFGLNDLFEYNRSEGKGSEERRHEEGIPSKVTHPNARYQDLTRKIKTKRVQQTKVLARYGLVLEQKVEKKSNSADSVEENQQEIEPGDLEQFIESIRVSKDAKKLRQLNEEIAQLNKERSQEPKRTTAASDGFKQLRRGVSHLVDSIKMVAYELDTCLFEMLEGHYSNREKEGRKLIAAALRSRGSLRLAEGKLIVNLEAQASPNRTAAIDEICRKLNQMQAKYPGTDLQIEFDTHRP